MDLSKLMDVLKDAPDWNVEVIPVDGEVIVHVQGSTFRSLEREAAVTAAAALETQVVAALDMPLQWGRETRVCYTEGTVWSADDGFDWAWHGVVDLRFDPGLASRPWG